MEGSFDAKGIETVRRDTCPVVQKMLSKSLRMLFTNPDLSAIKAYHQRQYRKMLAGNVSWIDFVFCKEVKRSPYRVKPAAVIVDERNQKRDQRSRALHRERVPYVVISDKPDAPLYQLVVNPHDLLDSKHNYRLNTLYYINNQVLPALHRVFGMIGVDVKTWFNQVPRNVRQRTVVRGPLHQFFGSLNCAVCDVRMPPLVGDQSQLLCVECSSRPQQSLLTLQVRRQRLELQYLDLAGVCATCTPHGRSMDSPCVSIDCPIFFKRKKHLNRLLECDSELLSANLCE